MAAQIDVPLMTKIRLYEELKKQEKKTGFEIDVSRFVALAIQEKLERQFTNNGISYPIQSK